jgi:hypothetical protein
MKKKEDAFDFSDKTLERIEESFWRGIRIRYWKRNGIRGVTTEDGYDIELLLNTVQILKSNINQLEKRIEKLEKRMK